MHICYDIDQIKMVLRKITKYIYQFHLVILERTHIVLFYYALKLFQILFNFRIVINM